MKLRYVLSSVALMVPMAVVAVVTPAAAGPAQSSAASPGASAKVPSLLRDAAKAAAAKQTGVKARALSADASGQRVERLDVLRGRVLRAGEGELRARRQVVDDLEHRGALVVLVRRRLLQHLDVGR